jgi:hypothetical protein
LEIFVLYLSKINPKLFLGELVLLLHGPSESKEVSKGVKELGRETNAPNMENTKSEMSPYCNQYKSIACFFFFLSSRGPNSLFLRQDGRCPNTFGATHYKRWALSCTSWIANGHLEV